VHCPSYLTLSPRTEEERAILAQAEVHAWSCSTCAEFLDELRELEPRLVQPDFDWEPTTPCPSAAELAAWGERAPPEEGIEHLAACAACRGDLLLVRQPDLLRFAASGREVPETPSQRLRADSHRRRRSSRLRKVIVLRDRSAHAPITAIGAAAALIFVFVLLAVGGDATPQPVVARSQPTRAGSTSTPERVKRPTESTSRATVRPARVALPESVSAGTTVSEPPPTAGPEPLEFSDDESWSVEPEAVEEELAAYPNDSEQAADAGPIQVDADAPLARSETEQPIEILASAGVELKSEADAWVALEDGIQVHAGQLLRASKGGASLAVAQGRMALATSAVLFASAPMRLLQGELLLQGQNLSVSTPAGRLEISGEVHMLARRGRIRARLLRGVASLAHRGRRLVLEPMQEVTAGRFAITAVRRLARVGQPGWLAQVPTVLGSALALAAGPDGGEAGAVASGAVVGPAGSPGGTGEPVKGGAGGGPPSAADPPATDGDRETRHAGGRPPSGRRASGPPPSGANRGGDSGGQPPRGGGGRGGDSGSRSGSRGGGGHHQGQAGSGWGGGRR